MQFLLHSWMDAPLYYPSVYRPICSLDHYTFYARSVEIYLLYWYRIESCRINYISNIKLTFHGNHYTYLAMWIDDNCQLEQALYIVQYKTQPRRPPINPNDNCTCQAAQTHGENTNGGHPKLSTADELTRTSVISLQPSSHFYVLCGVDEFQSEGRYLSQECKPVSHRVRYETSEAVGNKGVDTLTRNG